MKRIVLTSTILLAASGIAWAQATPYTPGQNIPAPQGSTRAQDAAPQAGKPGPVDPNTGMSQRPNFDARSNAASDNSTGTAPQQETGSSK